MTLTVAQSAPNDSKTIRCPEPMKTPLTCSVHYEKHAFVEMLGWIQRERIAVKARMYVSCTYVSCIHVCMYVCTYVYVRIHACMHDL